MSESVLGSAGESGSGAAILPTSPTVSVDPTNTSLICYEVDFDSAISQAVAAIRLIGGLFSLICSAIVIIIIVACKKYTCLPQRLFLYLAIATLLHAIAYILGRVRFSGSRHIEDPYCTFSGVLELYTGWVELLSITNINLQILALFHFKKHNSNYDIAHFVVCYFLPLLWCWIPFLHGAFGSAGPWCGIRIYNEDCTFYLFGTFLRFFLWQIPLYTVFLVIFIVVPIVFTVRLKKEVLKWEGVYNPKAIAEKKKMLSILKPMLWYPLIYLILKFPFLVTTIYDSLRSDSPIYVVWFAQAFTSPLAGPILALVYTVDTDTWRRLRRVSKKPYYTIRKKLLHKTDCKNSSGEIEIYGRSDIYTMYGDSLEGNHMRAIDHQRNGNVPQATVTDIP